MTQTKEEQIIECIEARGEELCKEFPNKQKLKNLNLRQMALTIGEIMKRNDLK